MQNNILHLILLLAVLWIAAASLFKLNKKQSELFLKLFLSVNFLLFCAMTFITSREQSSVEHAVSWVGLQTDLGLTINLKFDAFRATFINYIYFVFLTFYFTKEEKNPKTGMFTAALLSGAIILMVGCENIFTLLAGHVLALIATLYLIGFGESYLEQRADAFSSWLVTRLLGTGIVILAAVALFRHSPSLLFSEIEKNKDSIPEWNKITMLFGLIILAFSFPVLNAFRSIVYAGVSAPIGLAVSLPLFIGIAAQRLHGTFLSIQYTEYVLPLLLLTFILVAIYALTERDSLLIGAFIAIFGSIFMLIATTTVQPNVSAASCLSFFVATVLTPTLIEKGKKYRAALMVVLLSMTGIPLFSNTWALAGFFEETLFGISSAEGAKLYFGIAIVVTTMIGFLIFSLAIFGLIKDTGVVQKESDDKRPLSLTLLYFSAASTIGILSGTPLFSSIANKIDYSWARQLQWFIVSVSSREEMTAANQQMSVYLISNVVITAILSLAALYSNETKSKSTRAGVDRFLGKFAFPGAADYSFHVFVWTKITAPVLRFVSSVICKINNSFVNTYFKVAKDIYLLVQNYAKKIDEKIVERTFSAGISGLFNSASRALRFIQHGQVQFYLGFGAVLFLGIIYRILYYMLK